MPNTLDTRPSSVMDALYSRCPRCGSIGPAESLDYAVRDGGIDWRHAVTACCLGCSASYDVREGDVLAHDAARDCTRCDALIGCPANAKRICCLACRLYQRGPAQVAIVV